MVDATHGIKIWFITFEAQRIFIWLLFIRFSRKFDMQGMLGGLSLCMKKVEQPVPFCLILKSEGQLVVQLYEGFGYDCSFIGKSKLAMIKNLLGI